MQLYRQAFGWLYILAPPTTRMPVKLYIHKLNKFAMAAEFCSNRLPIVHANSMHSKPGVCCRCRVWEPSGYWRALWKASSVPPNLKSTSPEPCLAVGMFVQPMFGIIITVMLKTASSGNYNFELFCPTMLTVCDLLFRVAYGLCVVFKHYQSCVG